MSGKGRRGKSTSVVNVTKKDTVRKHFHCSLLWSADQSIQFQSRQVHIVLQPLAVTAVGVENQALYFVADTAGGPLVCAI